MRTDVLKTDVDNVDNVDNRARILVRVSSDKQAEDDRTSLPTQERVCRERAAHERLSVDFVYREEGVSGSLYHSRAAMQEALAAMERGEYRTLIIATMSRYSRDRRYQSEIRERIRQAGGRLLSCDLGEIDDKDPSRRLMANVHGDFDEYERLIFRKRTMDGRADAARDGRIPQRCWVAYGCYVVQEADIIRGDYPEGAAGTLLHTEPGASVVKRAYQMAAPEPLGQDLSLYAIARQFNREGVPTAKGTGPWHASTLHQMLTNPVYKGEYTCNKAERFVDESRLLKGRAAAYTLRRPTSEHIVVKVPALVSPELWDAVNARLQVNQSHKGGRPEYRQMLTGLVRCADCRRAACYQGSGGRAYVCNHAPVQGVEDAETYHGDILSPRHSIRFRAEIAERLVAQAVQGALTRPEAIAAAVEEYRASQESKRPDSEAVARRQLRAAENTLTDIRRRQAAAVRMQIEAAAEGLSTELYTTELKRLSQEESAAVAAVETARAATQTDRNAPVSLDPIDPIDTAALLSHTTRALTGVEGALLDKEIPGSIKNAVLRGLIETIWLHPNPDAAAWAKKPEKASPSRVDVVFRSMAGEKSADYTPQRDRGNSSLPPREGISPRLIVSVSTDGSIRFVVAPSLPAPASEAKREVSCV